MERRTGVLAGRMLCCSKLSVEYPLETLEHTGGGKAGESWPSEKKTEVHRKIATVVAHIGESLPQSRIVRGLDWWFKPPEANPLSAWLPARCRLATFRF